MSDTRAEITVREACRRRMALDGEDAQALEHALTITERERDAAESEVARLRGELRDSQNYRIEAAHDRGIEIEGLREEVARLRGLLGECAGWIGDTCDVIGMSDTRLNAARVLLRRLAAALEENPWWKHALGKLDEATEEIATLRLALGTLPDAQVLSPLSVSPAEPMLICPSCQCAWPELAPGTEDTVTCDCGRVLGCTRREPL